MNNKSIINIFYDFTKRVLSVFFAFSIRTKIFFTGVCTLPQAHLVMDVICRCLPPDRTWHKVINPKADYSVDLEEWKVGHEPGLEPCWSLLLIDPLSAMWV